MKPPIHCSIEALAACDALWDPAQNKWLTIEQVWDLLRQSRTPEEIRRENEEAQADFDRAIDEKWGGLGL